MTAPRASGATPALDGHGAIPRGLRSRPESFAVGISTRIKNVSVPAGAVTDPALLLEKKTNLHAWAVLPSTTAFGAWVSVEATKAGALTPSLFGGTFVPCPSCQSHRQPDQRRL